MSPERPRPDQGDPGPCPALAHENDHITHRLQHKIVTIITEIGSNFPKISFMDLQSRQNTFWVLRHGRSKANAAGVIVSTLENGTLPEWGLTEEGSNQARNAGASLRDALASASAPAPAPLVVVASPFSRTRETALCVADVVDLPPSHVIFDDRLRERDFGDILEGGSHDRYDDCWRIDQESQGEGVIPGRDRDGESVVAVSSRLRSLLTDLDQQHVGTHILCVSHGDCLQILQSTVVRLPKKEYISIGSPSPAASLSRGRPSLHFSLSSRRHSFFSFLCLTPFLSHCLLAALQHGTPLGEHRARYPIQTGQLVRITPR
jgi:broad specificity phosphatase PhoE